MKKEQDLRNDEPLEVVAVSGPAEAEMIEELLKNNGILPLRRDHASLLVCGPTAASTTALLGNYFGISPRLTTIIEGITGRVAEGCRVAYRTGCPLSSPMSPGVNYTWRSVPSGGVCHALWRNASFRSRA